MHASIIDKFLAKSNCATEKKQKQFLLKLLGNKLLITTILYSGSIHGWMYKDFHSRSYKKGPTIILFKVKDGDCIGGYTKAQWSSEDKSVRDSNAMLFNLSKERHFPNRGIGGEIRCGSAYGPHYGWLDLVAYEPYNGDRKCASYAGQNNYGITFENRKNMLTNTYDGNFTITELEVWEVKEMAQ